MAKLGNIDIANKNSEFDCGAAFLLSERDCSEAKIVIVEPDSQVEVQQSNSYVVVRSKGFNNLSNLAEELYEVAQKGLDLLCISGIANFSIHRASDEHLIWWRENSQQILRVVCIHKLRFGVTIISSDNLKPQQYHKSLRYFRLSQITDDLSDAYRNMYLALELLVSLINPRKTKINKNSEEKPDEAEKVWLKRALNVEASKIQNFQPIDEEIIEEIYEKRCSLFHAKKDYILPQSYDSSERKNIIRILRKLTEIFISLAETYLNLGRSGGVLPLSAFKSLTEWMKVQPEMIISDTSTIARHAPTLSDLYRETILGEVSLTDLEKFGNISEFIFKDSKTTTSLPVNLEAEMTCESIDKLQVVAGLEFIDSGGLKFFFRT